MCAGGLMVVMRGGSTTQASQGTGDSSGACKTPHSCAPWKPGCVSAAASLLLPMQREGHRRSAAHTLIRSACSQQRSAPLTQVLCGRPLDRGAALDARVHVGLCLPRLSRSLQAWPALLDFQIAGCWKPQVSAHTWLAASFRRSPPWEGG